ncbi:excisionase family DNA-binding protein [Mycolicibacterium goodii]|uniref:excisionase family DNA-binding protein n=1 Tax=Mycolicibacterium goodii TaxID=134601 RepID=UPI001BDBE327|nr:excisionase family DNA-binding protein [Mycolicibacterium goodii]MBU8831166.1 excisionase family DNA-binding protein [Mycolicibacterium goodii]
MSTTDNDQRPLTTSQLARELGCCQRQVQRGIADGTIPAFRVGRHYRIRRVDANALMARLAANPDNPPTPLGDAE